MNSWHNWIFRGGRGSRGLTRNSIAIADLDADGDGDLDVVVGMGKGDIAGDRYNGEFTYFQNDSVGGDPSFTRVTGAANPFDGFYVRKNAGPAFGDFDGLCRPALQFS